MPELNNIERAREVLDIEIEGLIAVRDNLDDSFNGLVDRCRHCLAGGGKLVLTGIGKSGHIARKMAATLSSTGSPAVHLDPVDAMHGDLGVLARNDLLLALSFSGETEELLQLLPAIRRCGIPIAAITGNADSRLAQWSECVQCLPVPREACPFNLAPTATTTAMLAFGDALAMVLLDANGLQQKDYARLHPAGAIGRRITLTVGDVMRRGNRLPTVETNTTLRDCLPVMTRKRSGSVLVVDPEQHLLGIFTDGDFRRHMLGGDASLDIPVGQVMTENPVTADPDELAVELLELLEQHPIDDVAVVDGEGRAVGLIDSQDLPGFKLM